MAHNPVQVVLNTEQYMKRPEGGGGGSAKDFFEGRDNEFVKHREKLLRDFSGGPRPSEALESPGWLRQGALLHN